MPPGRLTPEQLAERQRVQRERMQRQREARREGWEERKAEMSPEMRAYYDRQDELYGDTVPRNGGALGRSLGGSRTRVPWWLLRAAALPIPPLVGPGQGHRDRREQRGDF